jgi:RNA polymerase sigma factor (sigma-70 family)
MRGYLIMSKETALDKLNQLIKEMGLEGEPVVYMKVRDRNRQNVRAEKAIRGFVPESYKDAPIIPRPQPMDYFRPEYYRTRQPERRKPIIEVAPVEEPKKVDPPKKPEEIDFTGNIYGRLMVKQDLGKTCVCDCECGEIVTVKKEKLLSGEVQTCGHCIKPKNILSNRAGRGSNIKSIYNSAITGNSEAMDAVIKHYYPLLNNIAEQIIAKYELSDSVKDDLVQEGTVALWQFVLQHNDWDYFKSWLNQIILNKVGDYALHNCSSIYMSRYYKQDFTSISCEPIEECIDEIDSIDTYQVEFFSVLNEYGFTVDQILHELNTNPMFDNERASKIVVDILLKEKTFKQVGKEIGRSQERVRQILIRTCRRLRRLPQYKNPY